MVAAETGMNVIGCGREEGRHCRRVRERESEGSCNRETMALCGRETNIIGVRGIRLFIQPPDISFSFFLLNVTFWPLVRENFPGHSIIQKLGCTEMGRVSKTVVSKRRNVKIII